MSQKKINIRELSKQVSYILRHAPWKYELELDNEGWVDIEQLLQGLKRDKRFYHIKRKHIEMLTQLEKKRHEISGNHIRALYGHSITLKRIARVGWVEVTKPSLFKTNVEHIIVRYTEIQR